MAYLECVYLVLMQEEKQMMIVMLIYMNVKIPKCLCIRSGFSMLQWALHRLDI